MLFAGASVVGGNDPKADSNCVVGAVVGGDPNVDPNCAGGGEVT